MPIEHLGTIPAQTPALTQMLQGLAGGVQTGMGYGLQKKQLQQQQSVLDFEMQKWSDVETDKYTETVYGLWKAGDEATKGLIESKVKSNPIFMGELEDRGFWWGGPEGGFAALAEEKETDYQLSKYGDDYILWDKLNPKDREFIPVKKAEKAEIVEGEPGYFQYTKDGIPVGDSFYVGPKIDLTNIKEFTHEGVTVVYDMTDPKNPIRLAQITVPTAELTPTELAEKHYKRIKDAEKTALERIGIPYESMMLVEDDKVREGLIGRLEIDYRRYLKEELIIGNVSETEATKIAAGAPLPPNVPIIYSIWVDADTGDRARIEWFIKNTPDLLAQAETHPDIWDVEKGGFIVPTEERGVLERLLTPLKPGERPIDKHLGLDEINFEGAMPTEPVEEPKPAAIPKEGALYTPEINAEVEKDKKYAEENPGSLKAMQTELKAQGYWDYNITGKWTPTWEKAVRQFYRDQIEKGLK